MRLFPRSLLALPVGLLGVAGVALAASWGDFKSAFPALPCQDGWAACLVDGQPVTPGMVLDSKGRPHPADMRIGFFEFDALPGLSPFGSLSAYKGGEVPTADSKDTTAAPPVASAEAGLAATERETARLAAQAARDAEQAEAAAAREAERTAQAETKARQVQESTRKAAEQATREAASATDATSRAEAERRADTARKAATDAQVRAEQERKTADAARKAQEAESARKAQADAARVAAEEQARKSGEAAAQADAARKEAEATARSKEAAALAARTSVGNNNDAAALASTPPPETPAAGPATCDNLVALEVPAMMGNLGAPVRGCLEKGLTASASQTSKDKISRVLIADAEARRDQAEWEKLMKRHLESIDRSDPNLCFKYALHLSRGGVGRATGVIRWADYALENKQQWEGATYIKNVSGLYKVRAQAANRIWEDAEKKVVEDRSEENEAKAERARGQTKDFAREWLDYARASAGDTATALALCVSAAGNKEFCGG